EMFIEDRSEIFRTPAEDGPLEKALSRLAPDPKPRLRGIVGKAELQQPAFGEFLDERSILDRVKSATDERKKNEDPRRPFPDRTPAGDDEINQKNKKSGGEAQEGAAGLAEYEEEEKHGDENAADPCHPLAQFSRPRERQPKVAGKYHCKHQVRR